MTRTSQSRAVASVAQLSSVAHARPFHDDDADGIRVVMKTSQSIKRLNEAVAGDWEVVHVGGDGPSMFPR